MSEYTRANFKTQKDADYSDGLPAGSTTRQTHRNEFENVADSFTALNDLAPVTASGTNTYTATLANDPGASYASPNRFYLVKFTNANTASATINFNSRGAKDITKNGTTALVSGDIKAGQVIMLGWDGTRFQIIGTVASAATDILKSTRTISSAEILNSNSTPIEIIAAPGANNYIQVLSMVMSMDYNSVAYATNTDPQFIVGSENYVTFGGFLASTADTVAQANDVTLTGVPINQALNFKTTGGNPTAGNSSIKVAIYYSIGSL